MGFDLVEIHFPTLREVQRAHVEHAIKHFNGDKRETAKALGISLKTLYNHLSKYGITVERVRSFEVKKSDDSHISEG